jgi:DNA-binding Lrp family transcriptional regulator
MDKQILKILERDARTSSAQMAVMLGRSEEEINEAVKRLEESGVIRHYKAIVDWEKIGKEQVFAFIDVRVSPSRGVGFDDVAKRVYKYPEVHSVYLVSGNYDLRVVVEGKTMKHVAFFVADKLATIEHVQSTTTHFLLKTYKEDTDIFEETPGDRRLAITP